MVPQPQQVVEIEDDNVLPMSDVDEPEEVVVVEDDKQPAPVEDDKQPAPTPILTIESLTEITASDFPRVKEVFHKMDIDSSGTLSLQEFVTALQKCFPGACLANIEELYRFCDIDGNGSVTLGELDKRLRHLKNRKKVGVPTSSSARSAKKQAADAKDIAARKKSEDASEDVTLDDLSQEEMGQLKATLAFSEDHGGDSLGKRNAKGEDLMKFKRFSCVRWREQTNSSVETAAALVKQASSHIEAQLEESLKPRRVNGDVEDDRGVSIVRITMQKRLGMQDALLKSLSVRCESMEATIRQAGECLHSLQRAARAQAGPLGVCEMRLKLREKRPTKELVRDDCQIVLEQHRDAVSSGREELDQWASRMKVMLQNLDGCWERLFEDLQSRRHAARMDKQIRNKDYHSASKGLPSLSAVSPAKARSEQPSPRMPLQDEGVSASGCLALPQLPGRPASQQMSMTCPGGFGRHKASAAGEQLMSDEVKPSPRATPRKAGREEHVKEEGMLTQRTYNLIKASAALEEEALSIIEEAKVSMLKLQQRLEKHGLEATKFLHIRVRELLRLKTNVENQLMETDKTLYAMQLTYDRIIRDLRAHQEPLKAVIAQQLLASRMRKRDAQDGAMEMSLLVEKEMRDTIDRMQAQVDELHRKAQATLDLLGQLKVSRSALREDQKNKLQCQKIDASCLQLTYKTVVQTTPRSAARVKEIAG